MRHYGEKVIIKSGQIASFLMKELMREVNVEEEESDPVKKDRAKLVDVMVRMKIKKMQLSESAIKFYYGCNHYGERDK